MPKTLTEKSCIKSCQICETTESKRWYFGNVCRSCRRKQLYETSSVLKTREIRAANKANPKCWDCEKTDSYRWYKDHTQCQSCFNLEYRAKNANKLKEYSQTYNRENRKKINESKRNYRKRTGKHRFLESKRKAKKLNAMPKWVNTKDINSIYKNCPNRMTVDHIIPLQNNMVCGLHVPWNLTYLTLSDNSKKHNQFDGTVTNESWKIDA